MPSPIKFLNVQVDVAATPPAVTYSGDCDPSGRVDVDVRDAPTDIWLMLWTLNAPGNPAPVATLKDLTWPEGQPAWISSVGRPPLPASQNNPAWVLTSFSKVKDEQVSFLLDLVYQGAPITADPTIINVDGTNLMPEKLPGSKGSPEKPSPQRPVPAAGARSTPAGPPAAARRRNSGSPRRRSNQGRLNHRAS